MSRKSIRRKKATEIISMSNLKLDLSKIGKVKKAETIEVRDLNLLLINEVPLLLYTSDCSVFFPFIESVDFFDCPSVIVDRGALPHILKGADVMIPGIISLEEFRRNEIIYIKAEGVNRVVAIGRALMSSKEIVELSKGKAVKNLHYIGDKIWKVVKRKTLN